jgi:hypothetical protein
MTDEHAGELARLIEASSFGTPGARELRQRTSADGVSEIIRRRLADEVVGAWKTELHRSLRESTLLGKRWRLVRDELPRGERGNHAQVWLAKDIPGAYPSDVVVKLAERNGESAREAHTVGGSALPPRECPYAAEILDHGYADGLAWTVMPYYRHGNLLQHFRGEPATRAVRQVLAVADHVLAALCMDPSDVGAVRGELPLPS